MRCMGYFLSSVPFRCRYFSRGVTVGVYPAVANINAYLSDEDMHHNCFTGVVDTLCQLACIQLVCIQLVCRFIQWPILWVVRRIAILFTTKLVNINYHGQISIGC